MKKHLLSGAHTLCGLIAVPSIADAAVQGFSSTANVNMRSGPSTSYPAVTVIPEGSPVIIYGCMSSVNWCNAAFSGGCGWVSGNYVQAAYQQRRVELGPRYYRPLGIATVTFEVGNSWDRHYRGRDFSRTGIAGTEVAAARVATGAAGARMTGRWHWVNPRLSNRAHSGRCAMTALCPRQVTYARSSSFSPRRYVLR